jgi:hypothetical protein
MEPTFNVLQYKVFPHLAFNFIVPKPFISVLNGLNLVFVNEVLKYVAVQGNRTWAFHCTSQDRIKHNLQQ